MMKRPLILAILVILVGGTMALAGRSLAQQLEDRTYSGPEFGKDPPRNAFGLLEKFLSA